MPIHALKYRNNASLRHLRQLVLYWTRVSWFTATMTKRKHHFVPRFYLAAFQSAPRRVHLCNLKSGLAVKDASLKSQCYRRSFYGEANLAEDHLAALEAMAAPVLRTIRTERALPRAGTAPYLTLLAFVTAQLLRTTVAARRTETHVDKTMKQIHSRDPRLSGFDLETIRFGYAHPALVALGGLPQMLEAVEDLRGHLVISAGARFLTSDNPAFRYNQYCEGISHVGITGALCRGFEIFLPLAPDQYLVLYDDTTYKVRLLDSFSRCSSATAADEVELNRVQLVSADENVYFSGWELAEGIRSRLADTARDRIPDPTVVQEYGQDDDPNRSLLHTFERTPNLKLELSFLAVRRRRERIPVESRAGDYRKTTTVPAPTDPPGVGGGTVTFSRFLGRR